MQPRVFCGSSLPSNPLPSHRSSAKIPSTAARSLRSAWACGRLRCHGGITPSLPPRPAGSFTAPRAAGCTADHHRFEGSQSSDTFTTARTRKHAGGAPTKVKHNTHLDKLHPVCLAARQPLHVVKRAAVGVAEVVDYRGRVALLQEGEDGVAPCSRSRGRGSGARPRSWHRLELCEKHILITTPAAVYGRCREGTAAVQPLAIARRLPNRARPLAYETETSSNEYVHGGCVRCARPARLRSRRWGGYAVFAQREQRNVL
jgi:hypothetical protein